MTNDKKEFRSWFAWPSRKRGSTCNNASLDSSSAPSDGSSTASALFLSSSPHNGIQQSSTPSTPQERREKLENVLTFRFMSLFHKTFEQLKKEDDMEREAFKLLNGKTPLPESPAFALQRHEREATSRTTYQNWTLGALAGAVALGTMVGISWYAKRWEKQRTYASYLVASSASRRRGNNTLDVVPRTKKSNRAASASPFSRTQQPSQQNQQSTVMESSTTTSSSASFVPTDEAVMTQVEVMIMGAATAVVTICVSSLYADTHQYFQGLAQVPLQPGRSALCHQVCPILIEEYERLLLQDRPVSAIEDDLMDDNDDENAEHQRQLDQVIDSLVQPSFEEQEIDGDTAESPNGKDMVRSVLQDPQSLPLESMTRLVFNCRQRMAFESDMWQRQQRQQQPSSTLNNQQTKRKSEHMGSPQRPSAPLEVPKPGVPKNYLGIEV